MSLIFATDATSVSPEGDIPIDDGVPEILHSHVGTNRCTTQDGDIPSAHA